MRVIFLLLNDITKNNYVNYLLLFLYKDKMDWRENFFFNLFLFFSQLFSGDKRGSARMFLSGSRYPDAKLPIYLTYRKFASSFFDVLS